MSQSSATAVAGQAVVPLAIAGAARETAARVADSVRRRFPDSTTWKQTWEELLLMEGLLATARALDRPADADYVKTWLDHHLAAGLRVDRRWPRYDWFPRFTSWGPTVVAVELHRRTGDERYREAARAGVDYICNRSGRLESGAVEHLEGLHEAWCDTMYYAVTILAHYGAAFAEPRYLEEAVAQVQAHAAHLQEPDTGLFFHAYDEWWDRTLGCFWGRGNGWITASVPQLLDRLPPDHGARPSLQTILQRIYAAALPLQDTSGHWRTVLDQPETYPETTATAMLLFGLVKGLQGGWLDGVDPDVISRAWQALEQTVSDDGVVTGASFGTTVGDWQRYNSVPTGEISYGTGVLLQAAAELAATAPTGDGS